jgi:hypothetical protein
MEFFNIICEFKVVFGDIEEFVNIICDFKILFGDFEEIP